VASKTAEARQRQVQLPAETGIAVECAVGFVVTELRSSSRICGWQRHIVWSDESTLNAITASVDRLPPGTSALELMDLRALQPISVALVIARNIPLGIAPLADDRRGGELEHHLQDLPSPERGTDSDVEPAAELCRHSPAGTAQDMADEADLSQRAELRARLTPPDKVLPFRRPDHRR